MNALPSFTRQLRLMDYIYHRIARLRYSARLPLFLLGWTVALLTGCAAPRAAAPLQPLFFPPPPEPARFVFERTLLGSGDLELLDRNTRLRRMLTGESSTGTGFNKPFDVTVCQGKIFVSDSVRRSVMVFDVSAGRFFEIGESEPGHLYKPLGLASDGACNVYVADATAKRVAVYDQAGQFLRAIGGTEWFERLSHVAVNREGTRVFAVDTGGVKSNSHRVRVFDAVSGQHLHDIGSRGTGAGQFNLPRDAEVGPDGLLYVIDGGNFRVESFQQDGTFVRSFGAVGRQFGQFSRPKGIAIDHDGNVYVSDSSHGNFQIFDPQGHLLLFIGDRSEKFERAKYMLPAGLAIDEDGRVYMVDQFFRKVDIYRPARLAETEGFLGVWAQRQER
ncbi:MAG: 6-bladed beta-propeller [Gammaproteobacteria bacterium]